MSWPACARWSKRWTRGTSWRQVVGTRSTEVIALYFGGSDVTISSVDLVRSEGSGECERRLQPYRNVELYYGNAFRILPHIVAQRCEPTVLLIDGAKGTAAVQLAQDLMRQSHHVVAAFLRDSSVGSAARAAVQDGFPAHAFTDMPELVAKLAHLDRGIQVGAVQPLYTGDPALTQQPPSDGPTLALLLPTAVGEESPRRR